MTEKKIANFNAKIPKSLLDEFRRLIKAKGLKIQYVISNFMFSYIEKNEK